MSLNDPDEAHHLQGGECNIGNHLYSRLFSIIYLVTLLLVLDSQPPIQTAWHSKVDLTYH
ncbi:hypothetical protein TanjilG_28088 [Lupinus angustifolius]|uniref:Uncharacterized protein n=1 Tax=Lupinus angustifolius TaxID=3871 RepID=A0A4P1RGD2_LUPAN|nr:hypothetical protein TanjilG_28088 [Lupinus angustifolius]